MTKITLENVTKKYGNSIILNDVNLEIEKGEFVVIIGPSGCGKSTLLRLIAGLEDISSGSFHLDGQRMNDIPPVDRKVAMVFQSYALYPHMDVAENMAFGMKIQGAPKAVIQKRIAEVAQILQIDTLLKRKPKQLSGGQRQRVAIGRAIMRQPEIFLFDEPLSNLDAGLRTQTRIEIASLHRQFDAPMIYVTHDQLEAMTLADRIVVLNAGRVEQIGKPLDLYNNPANRFVAGFIGSQKMNFLKASVDQVERDHLRLGIPGNGTIDIPASNPRKLSPGDNVEIGIRPEHIKINSNGIISVAKVKLVEQLGDMSVLHVETPNGDMISIRNFGQTEIDEYDAVTVSLDVTKCHIFDTNGAVI